MKNLSNIQKIGDIMTPVVWGEFAIAQFGLVEKWLAGASIFDPTMGCGNLLESLIRYAGKKGYNLQKLPISFLYGNELNKSYLADFFARIKRVYGLNLPQQNFTNEDLFFQTKNQKFDILFGNPPWVTFANLPSEYKAKIKSFFHKYDLVSNSQSLLLGGSRIDLAALVVQKTIAENLKEHGEAIFFLPLSLFLNQGASNYFRKYSVAGTNYSVEQIFDFQKLKIFESVATRYGLIKFLRDKKCSFPISYHLHQNHQWKQFWAKPLFGERDPLSITKNKNSLLLKNFKSIVVKKTSQPRQGINPCGASKVFFFTKAVDCNLENYLATNKNNTSYQLPKKYLFPLLSSKNFIQKNKKQFSWVLLPYNDLGKPLAWEVIKQNHLLCDYLLQHKTILQQRKGQIIGSWIKRGFWWAMLGVGAYNFAPYKIVWEAYGRKKFNPLLFQGFWQVNQSLQAYIPTETKKEATNILKKLVNKRIEQYLASLRMEGTMNWAQPGKIKQFLTTKK